MELINGKFIESGKVIPVENFNDEQIKCLQRAERKLEELKNGDFGTSIVFEVRASFNFDCVCGKVIFGEEELTSEEDTSQLNQLTLVCRNCGKSYQTECDDNESLIFIKLIDEESN